MGRAEHYSIASRQRRGWACVLLGDKTYCIEDRDEKLYNVCYGLRGTYYCYRLRREDAIQQAHEHFVDGYLSDIDYYQKDGFVIEGLQAEGKDDVEVSDDRWTQDAVSPGAGEQMESR